MTDAQWVGVISKLQIAAAALVAVGVSVEFLGDWIKGPIEHRIAEARELELRRLETTAAEATGRAAEANRKAEEERLARIKIEERMAGRRISKEQHDLFVTKLLPFKGTSIGFTQLSDFEATVFANDLRVVLNDAGWVLNGAALMSSAIPEYDLRIAIKPGSRAAVALADVFSTLPTARAVSVDPTLHDSDATVFVGLRPPP